jgi:hypothetical protein
METKEINWKLTEKQKNDLIETCIEVSKRQDAIFEALKVAIEQDDIEEIKNQVRKLLGMER